MVSAPASQLEALVTTLGALYDNAATGYVSELNVSNPHALYLYSRTGMRVDLGDSADMDDKVLWMVGALPRSGGARRDLGAAGRFQRRQGRPQPRLTAIFSVLPQLRRDPVTASRQYFESILTYREIRHFCPIRVCISPKKYV